ncbi:MAG: hypothetical protein Pg6B_04380 [Candidatus Azobacteroides pseudotrichonymphae]|uniref:Sigma-70 family RNA polymerase sigma factor n=1 Tax=Candidatus Improbicoccus pseudotrichonymphae TaxID=3033792 RepID=A0AA48HXT7_9FIRM|nr:MAG: sigma-70 family RNA polymerase sigma factor [Candidatus Improbicoccus pseudotrichonymphae]GMO33977.1 MAG: hypothetical protein Pg6B_04380 [Candidatus Azobacteroides pseudotrichonymphae]
MYKIKVEDHDGKIIEVEVTHEIYKFDKENFWQEDWRKRKRKQENTLDSINEDPSLLNLLSKKLVESTEESYIKKFTIEKLHEAIEKLPEKQRRRIILRFFHNFTNKQIAEAEKITERAIECSIKKSLEMIKKFLL